MRALSIRQPWAELILRGVKTVEYRSRRTHRPKTGRSSVRTSICGPFTGAKHRDM